MERGNDSEAKREQREGRVDKAGQRKSKEGNQVQMMDSVVAKGVTARPGEDKRKVVKTSQGQSIAREHDDVVPRLLGYQAFLQKRLLFNYEAAGPWFEEVRLRLCPHYVVVPKPHEPTCCHTK